MPSDVTRFPILELRASTNSNIFNSDGSRSSKIGVFHFVNGLTEMTVNQEFCTRVYNMKDSKNSIRTFDVRWTDPGGELIPFQQEWELEIAVFFKSH